jgi:uncharacterized protein
VAKRGPGNPNWKRGGPSPNPAGRGASRRDSAEPTLPSTKLNRRDGWENSSSGHGGARDRRTLTRFGVDVVTDIEALQLWRSEFLAARIIEAWAEAAYRRGWSIKTDDEALGKKMRAWADDLGVEAAVTQAANYEAAYGGAAIFPVLEGALGDLSQPLDLKTGNIERISALHVLEPRELQPDTWYTDITDVGWQRPSVWRLNPLQVGRSGWAGMQRVHDSRLIIWRGTQVSRQTQPGQREGWGDSVLCRPRGVIADFGLAWGSAATLLHQHGRSTLKKDGLKKMLAMADGLDQWDKSLIAMQMAWTTIRMNAIDADDDITQSTGTLAGVSDTLNAFKSLMSAATEGIPLSVLFGESQTGLRSGDADNESWDAKVEGRRNKKYKPPHERILKLMFLSSDGPAGGEEPEVWSLEYPPLSAPTESDLATIRKTNVDKAEKLVVNGIASADDIAESYYKTSPDGDIKGDVHINFERRAQQAVSAQQTPDQMSPEDMAAMGYEPDDGGDQPPEPTDGELDQMAADDQTADGTWEDGEVPTDEHLDDLEAQDDEAGADLEWDDGVDEEPEDKQRRDDLGGHGYNPYRSHGKFASGPHKERPKTGRAAGAAEAPGGGKGAAKPKAARTKFDDSAHKAKIAEHKATELHHRTESLHAAEKMRGLNEQAKSLPRGKAGQAARADLKAQHAELGKQRDAHRELAMGARTSRIAASKEMQSARREHVEGQKAASGASIPKPAAKAGEASPSKTQASKDINDAFEHAAGGRHVEAQALFDKHGVEVPDNVKSMGRAEGFAYRSNGGKKYSAADFPEPSSPKATRKSTTATGEIPDKSLNGMRRQLEAKLTKEERGATHAYATGYDYGAAHDNKGVYVPLNKSLRGIAKSDPAAEKSLAEMTVHMDSAIAKSRIASPVLTYRTTAASVFSHMKAGDVFIDHGFASTSTSDKHLRDYAAGYVGAAQRPTMMHITSPAGTKLAAIGGIKSSMAQEKEMLMARGTAFRLDRRETSDSGMEILHMTVVGQS